MNARNQLLHFDLPTEAAGQSPHNVYVEPTAEMRTWARRLHSVLRVKSPLAVALVTPLAHVANGSFEFQAYLYGVFHRSSLAGRTHLTLMPFIVAATLGALWTLHTAAAVAAWGLLVAWYAALVARERLFAVGAVLAGCMILTPPLSAAWAQQGDRNALLSPVLWMVGLSLLQALSHAGESMVPPRVSGTSRWTPMKQFFLQAPAFNLPRATFMLAAGTFNEWWASWRLLPVAILQALWGLGYDRKRQQHLTALVTAAWDSGNPAIDFIGVGGACDGDYPVTSK